MICFKNAKIFIKLNKNKNNYLIILFYSLKQFGKPNPPHRIEDKI